jgi:hypothetical protein
MRRKLLVALGLVVLVSGPGAAAARADFVCPVLSVPAHAADASPKIGPLPTAGEYTISGPTLSVPDQATNSDGAGSPESHVSPGDTGYTPIWNTP